MYCKQNDEEYRTWREQRTGDPVYKEVVTLRLSDASDSKKAVAHSWGELSVWPDGVLFLAWPRGLGEFVAYVGLLWFLSFFLYVPFLVWTYATETFLIEYPGKWFPTICCSGGALAILSALLMSIAERVYSRHEGKFAPRGDSAFFPADRILAACSGTERTHKNSKAGLLCLLLQGDTEHMWAQAIGSKDSEEPDWASIIAEHLQKEFSASGDVSPPPDGWLWKMQDDQAETPDHPTAPDETDRP